MKAKELILILLVAAGAFYSERIFRAVVVLSVYGFLLNTDHHKKLFSTLKEKMVR